MLYNSAPIRPARPTKAPPAPMATFPAAALPDEDVAAALAVLLGVLTAPASVVCEPELDPVVDAVAPAVVEDGGSLEISLVVEEV